MDPMGYIWLLYNNSIFQNYYVYCFFPTWSITCSGIHPLTKQLLLGAVVLLRFGRAAAWRFAAFCTWRGAENMGATKVKGRENTSKSWKNVGNIQEKKSKVEIMLTTVIVMFPPKLQVRLSDWWLSHTFQTLVVAVPEDHHFKCCCNRQGWIEKSDT